MLFIYLSKKIGISTAGQIYSVSWNHNHGWIACTGTNGQIKVLQLQGYTSTSSSSRSSSNIAMNQTLQGHRGNVIQTIWNQAFDKLTTTDQHGMIIVWILQDGVWHEEMINNRNQSVVGDMAWSSNGQQICIIYQDGAVIVGSVDGNRLWGKDLSNHLSAVAWSPESRTLLFGTDQGRVYLHSAAGQYLADLPTLSSDGARVTSIQWYDGHRGHLSGHTCPLAIAFSSGSIQFMKNTSDPGPLFISTPLASIRSMSWATNGQYLAAGGPGRHDASPLVCLYASDTQLMRQLPIPGQSLQSLCWDATSLSLCIAVDSFLYLGTVRARYPLLHLGDHTFVYSFQRADRPEQCLMFWDSHLNERYVKYIPDLLNMCSSGRHCLLACNSDDADHPSGTYLYIICSTIGSAVQSRYSMIEPKFVSMTSSCVISANSSCLYCWTYDGPESTPNTNADSEPSLIFTSAPIDDRILHIDDPYHTSASAYSLKRPSSRIKKPSQDPIAFITARNDVLLVARESGLIHKYSLPYLNFIQKFTLSANIQQMQMNCTCTSLALIDNMSTLLLIDIDRIDEYPSDSSIHRRKDVWDICWADDNPDLLACMEKSRIYIYRGRQAEEPISSSAYLAGFQDLVLTCIAMDEIQQDPHNPQVSHVVQYDTKSLRDTRVLLDTVPTNEVFQFISDNPHPRLWRLLAESALNRLDFVYANKAFVHCKDYQGIQLVKRLQKQVDKSRQLAEVAAHFKKFEEAEELYIREGHRHAAIDLRIQLGDWFRVVQLLQAEGSGNDELLQKAADSIGDYYADRMKWDRALKYYLQARNTSAAIEAAYNLEDYETLQVILADLPPGSTHCARIAQQFSSVGLCSESVQAFLKYGDAKGAIDVCIRLNEWSAALQLAEKHQIPQIETLMAQYAQHLLQKHEDFQAIELYIRAHRYHDSAALLKQQVDPAFPLTAKKLLVCAALQLDLAKKQIGNMGDKQEREQAITTLLNEDMATKSKSTSHESSWHAAEAYHFLLMSQRALYAKSFNSAMIAALRLQHYESVLSPKVIYSTIALAAFHNGFYEQCSNAFMKLEMLDGADQAERDSYRMLAFAIFGRYPPKDPATREFRCPNPSCSAFVNEWRVSCPSCETKFSGCVASGRSIFMSASSYSCACCDHAILESEMSSCTFCPLCHAAN